MELAVRRRAPAQRTHLCKTQCLSHVLQGASELRLFEERAKKAMVGGAEVVVGTGIASYDLMHAHRGADGPPRRLRNLGTHANSLTLHTTSKGASELRLLGECAK